MELYFISTWYKRICRRFCLRSQAVFLIIVAAMVLAGQGCRKQAQEDCFRLQLIYKGIPDELSCNSSVFKVEKSVVDDIPAGSLVTFVTHRDEYPYDLETGGIISVKLHTWARSFSNIYCPYDIQFMIQGDLCR